MLRWAYRRNRRVSGCWAFPPLWLAGRSGRRIGDPKIRQRHPKNWVHQHLMRLLCRAVFLPASPLSINSKQQMVLSFSLLLSLKPKNPAHGGAGQRAESYQRQADWKQTNTFYPLILGYLETSLGFSSPHLLHLCIFSALIIRRYSWELLLKCSANLKCISHLSLCILKFTMSFTVGFKIQRKFSS